MICVLVDLGSVTNAVMVCKILMIRKRASPENYLLPKALKVFFMRRFSEVLGSIFILLAMYLLVALLSFNHSDPSFNTAVDGQVNNITGYWGAIAADILLQYFGLPAYLLVGLLLAWARIKLSYTSVKRILLRSILIIIAMILFGVFMMATNVSYLIDSVINAAGALGGGVYNLVCKLQFIPVELINVTLALTCLPLALGITVYAFGLRTCEYLGLIKKLRNLTQSLKGLEITKPTKETTPKNNVVRDLPLFSSPPNLAVNTNDVFEDLEQDYLPEVPADIITKTPIV